ncbi:unnamed protein product [Hymenolepis diminuta]|uniref:MgtE domain-containing protein n=1 Tax=Hymenolepis diminuta TaxID=6216 RepID=A0A0R3SQW5_HYMDI|nr:unnamed protein product [Hymenolepis diminuta]VUZ47523.1 unnamed protein product [Hymenolepis diminuta]
MGHNKKNEKDVVPQIKQDNAEPKKKKFPKFRRHVHQGADIILVLLHSLLPLAIGAFLISLTILVDLQVSSSYFSYLGFLTGSGAIVLQITMIIHTLAPRNADKFMNWLMLSVDFIQFLVCTAGAIVTIVFTGKTHITVAAISLVNIIFCILPAFLAITSLMAAHQNSGNQESISREPSYASGRANPTVVIKRISSDIMLDNFHSKYYASR